MNTGYDFGDCSVLFQNKDKCANMRLIFQSQDVWRPSSPLRSNPSFLWLQIFHCTSFYQVEVKSNSCVLHWTQPHFQALFSVVTDNGMFMQMEFKHWIYTFMKNDWRITTWWCHQFCGVTYKLWWLFTSKLLQVKSKGAVSVRGPFRWGETV